MTIVQPLTPPLTPDSDEARGLLAGELSKPQYRVEPPNWFDELMSNFVNWIMSLLGGGDGTLNWIFLTVLVLIVAALIVFAFLVFGKPSLNRRSRVTGDLFGVAETRTAEELRAASQKAAQRGDWNEAYVLRFRALARSLNERTIVQHSPGTTAKQFARLASRALPELTQGFEQASDVFDLVRYLGGVADEQRYAQLVELDERAEQLRPAELSAIGASL